MATFPPHVIRLPRSGNTKGHDDVNDDALPSSHSWVRDGKITDLETNESREKFAKMNCARIIAKITTFRQDVEGRGRLVDQGLVIIVVEGGREGGGGGIGGR